MKHAVMIMAHKNFEFLHHLIEYFTRDCYVIVHIDKKSSITHEQEACLRAMPQVNGVYRKYSVHWGGFSILKCELFLLKQALHSTDADYFHLISGQDYPIKPLSTFLDFFEKNKGKEFLQYVHLPHPRWENNTFRRFQYFYLYDWFKRSPKNSHFIRSFVDWQIQHGLRRHIPDYFDHLYGASQWFSISKNATNILLTYTQKHPAFYRRMRFTFAPEECYVGTVIRNLMDRNCFAPYHYRFIRWRDENGNRPANLSHEHFHLLAESTCFFARKFDSPVSDDLRIMIDHWLLNDENIVHMPTGGWNYIGFNKYKYHESIPLAIHKLCQDLHISSVIDIGCGAGYNVAALRRLRIPATGCDANPNTPQLSGLLLPDGDETCSVVDITNPIESDDTFDMSLCLDVLPFIPPNLLEKTIRNICSLTDNYSIISWEIQSERECTWLTHRQLLTEDEIIHMFENGGMEVNVDLTNSFRFIMRKKNIKQLFLIFQRKGIYRSQNLL